MRNAIERVERLIDERRYAEARELLAAAYAEDSTGARAEFAAARIAVGEDDPSGALAHLETVLAREPTHREARVLAAGLLLDARRWEEADEAIRALVADHPEDPLARVLHAELLLAVGSTDHARQRAQEALELAPGDALARTTVALVATVTGDHGSGGGGDALTRLVRVAPETARSAYTLFAALVEQRRDEEALRVAGALHAADPENATLAEAVVELRAMVHPLARAARPLTRHGPAGVVLIWILAVLVIQLLRLWSLTATGIFAGLFLLYVIYAASHLPLLKRHLRDGSS